MSNAPKAGDPAPDFDIPGDAGQISLKALKGKTVVLYFYPKDDTSGCTAEAQAFTAAAAAFAKAKAVVVGVSKDTVSKHAKFRAKYDLAPLLGSDEDGDVVERYGAWVEKSMYGRKYMGMERSTFVIGPEGKLKAIYRKVKPAEHIAEVLATL